MKAIGLKREETVMTDERNAERPVVLCVDDDPEILEALRRTLRHEPYDLLTLLDPAKVHDWIECRGVSLVICDKCIPGTSGVELAQRMRTRKAGPLCVILTAYPERVPALESLDSGIRALIHKPWNDEWLRKTIRRLLQERGDPAHAKIAEDAR